MFRLREGDVLYSICYSLYKRVNLLLHVNMRIGAKHVHITGFQWGQMSTYKQNPLKVSSIFTPKSITLCKEV